VHSSERRFCGVWKNTLVEGLEPYLKHLGVGWAKRKIALAFRPEASWTLVEGTLQVITPTPIGERFESFPEDRITEDADPLSGGKLMVSHKWEDGRMVTTAAPVQAGAAAFVTARFRDGERLIQETCHAGFSFKRVFERKEVGV